MMLLVESISDHFILLVRIFIVGGDFFAVVRNDLIGIIFNTPEDFNEKWKDIAAIGMIKVWK